MGLNLFVAFSEGCLIDSFLWFHHRLYYLSLSATFNTDAHFADTDTDLTDTDTYLTDTDGHFMKTDTDFVDTDGHFA